MKKVGVIFGGRSVEHEVSVITGMQVMENIDKKKYEVVPIYITKEGKWLTGECLMDFANFKRMTYLRRWKCLFHLTVGIIRSILIQKT